MLCWLGFRLWLGLGLVAFEVSCGVSVVPSIRNKMLSRSGHVLGQDGEELRGVPFFVTASLGATSYFARALIIGKLAIG